MIPGHQLGRCEKRREGGSGSPPARDIVIVHSSDLHVDNDYTARIHGGDGTAGLACVLCKARSMSADLVLLAGDTFVHERIANVPPAMWHAFESPQILVQPTYASKYPPGQGFVLAVGQALTGHPIVGVWASFAAAAMAICWMLQAWVPPRWAF